jgi:hypothetical protein
MEKRVTKRDIYADIITMAREAEREDIVEFCEVQIEQLERKAEKAKERKASKAAAGDALKDAIAAVLTEDLQTAADITEKVMDAGDEVTRAKVVARLTKLVKEGVAGKMQVKVDKKKVMAYALAGALPFEDEEE